MNHRKTIILTLLLVAGIAMAASGKAGRNMPMTSTPGMGMYGQACVLSTEEQKQLYQAKLEFEKKALPLRAEIRVLNMEIEQMIASGKSGKELDAALDKLSVLRARLNKERVAHRVALRAAVGEEKYLQMGRYHRYSEQGNGPRMDMNRSCRNQRKDCYYSNMPRDKRDYRYHRR